MIYLSFIGGYVVGMMVMFAVFAFFYGRGDQ